MATPRSNANAATAASTGRAAGTDDAQPVKPKPFYAAIETELTFLFCVAGIYGCYLTYGVVQEQLLKEPHEDGTKFTFTFLQLFVQCSFNAALAGAAWFAQASIAAMRGGGGGGGGDGAAKSGLSSWDCQKLFALTATTYLAAMLCSNEALKYVSYPLQALAKSCKMIPVMVGQILVNRTRYPWQKYALVALMTAGVAGFQLSKASSGKPDKESSMLGVVLLLGSLAMDGVTGPMQQKLNKQFKPSNVAFMTLTNLYAVAIAFALTVATGELHEGVAYVAAHPRAMSDLVVFSATSAVGQLFIYYTVRTFGPLVLTTITTTRKFLTIIVSVIRFGHVLAPAQWGAVSAVFAALLGEMALKYSDKLPCFGRKPQAPHKRNDGDGGDAPAATGASANGTVRRRKAGNHRNES